jgi:hypothetical protein
VKWAAFPIFWSRCIDIQRRPKKSKNPSHLTRLDKQVNGRPFRFFSLAVSILEKGRKAFDF